MSRRFGAIPALSDVTMRVAWGERVAVLGANGAGKSTLLRVLATLTPPSAGEVRIAGALARREKGEARRHLGLLAHQTYLFGALTAEENLVFYARLYDVQDPRARTRTLLDRVGLAGRAREPARHLSRGLQQRLAIARALVHDPDILLLDEPDSGLDHDGLRMLSEIIDERPDRAVVLTTHHVERALALCQRAVILSRGRVARDTATRNLDGDAVHNLSAAVAG